MWSNPRARAAADCEETDQGDVREEFVVGKARGRKPGSHGSKAILLSHAWRGEPSALSLPTCQHQQLNNREASPSNAPDSLNYRA